MRSAPAWSGRCHGATPGLGDGGGQRAATELPQTQTTHAVPWGPSAIAVYGVLFYSFPFAFISCHAIPFYLLPCHSIPSHSISFHTFPFHAIRSSLSHSLACHATPFCPIPFSSIPFHPTSLYSIPFHTIPFHSIPFCFTQFYSIPCHSIPSYPILLHAMPCHSILSYPIPSPSAPFCSIQLLSALAHAIIFHSIPSQIMVESHDGWAGGALTAPCMHSCVLHRAATAQHPYACDPALLSSSSRNSCVHGWVPSLLRLQLSQSCPLGAEPCRERGGALLPTI